MRTTTSSFHVSHPFRTPDWRFQRARSLAASGRRPSPRRDDPEIAELVRFLRAQKLSQDDKSRARLERHWPGLCIASRIAASDGSQKWELDARLVAGQPDEDVASVCNLTLQSVRWYEAAHFHVRDRLQARDWVIARVIGPGLWHGFSREQRNKVWLPFAYFGGLPAFEVVKAVTQNEALPPWTQVGDRQNQPFQESRLRLAVRLLVEGMMAEPKVERTQLAEIHEAKRRLEGQPGIERPGKVLGEMSHLLDLTTATGRHPPHEVPTEPAPKRGNTSKSGPRRKKIRRFAATW